MSTRQVTGHRSSSDHWDVRLYSQVCWPGLEEDGGGSCMEEGFRSDWSRVDDMTAKLLEYSHMYGQEMVGEMALFHRISRCITVDYHPRMAEVSVHLRQSLVNLPSHCLWHISTILVKVHSMMFSSV